jgi:hypothetical protein
MADTGVLDADQNVVGTDVPAFDGRGDKVPVA